MASAANSQRVTSPPPGLEQARVCARCLTVPLYALAPRPATHTLAASAPGCLLAHGGYRCEPIRELPIELGLCLWYHRSIDHSVTAAQLSPHSSIPAGIHAQDTQPTPGRSNPVGGRLFACPHKSWGCRFASRVVLCGLAPRAVWLTTARREEGQDESRLFHSRSSFGESC
jgi:hypothetical protein